MFFEQINILKWFLKDHVSLKTRLISITGIHFIQNYIKIEISYFHNMFSGLVLFDQMNATFVTRDFFQKHLKKKIQIPTPNSLNCMYMRINLDKWLVCQ